MEKEELNVKLGYNNELLEQLANAFDLQEDYNDYGWNKLFEICRYIYNLEIQLKKQQEINQKAIEYIKSKENGKCIHNGIEKGAYTFVLDFDKAREFIWELLQILEDKEV